MSDRMALALLVGIPGSGKSSWVSKQPTEIRDGGRYLNTAFGLFNVVCPDQVREKMGNVNDQNRNQAVWEEVKRNVVECLQHGTGVLVDATNVNTTHRRGFMSGMPDCRKVALIFDTDPVVACGRIKMDIEAGKARAAVPDEIVYRMYGEFLYTMRVIHSEGFETFGC